MTLTVAVALADYEHSDRFYYLFEFEAFIFLFRIEGMELKVNRSHFWNKTMKDERRHNKMKTFNI